MIQIVNLNLPSIDKKISHTSYYVLVLNQHNFFSLMIYHAIFVNIIIFCYFTCHYHYCSKIGQFCLNSQLCQIFKQSNPPHTHIHIPQRKKSRWCQCAVAIENIFSEGICCNSISPSKGRMHNKKKGKRIKSNFSIMMVMMVILMIMMATITKKYADIMTLELKNYQIKGLILGGISSKKVGHV